MTIRTSPRTGALVALAATGALAVAATPAAAVIEDTDETTVVQVLGINDFHGRILPSAFDGNAGAASLAGAVDALEADWPNTVFAAAGDLIGASTFESFIADDQPTLDALSLAGLDVSSVGNHEFDRGYDDLVNRVMAPEGTDPADWTGAQWWYLGANVRHSHNGEAALPETWVQSFPGVDGEMVDVGFVGVVTDDTPNLVDAAGVSGLDFTDEAEAANDAAADLVADGAELVVMLVHDGAPTTDIGDLADGATPFGTMVHDLDPSIDAVISGHTHLAYDHRVEVPEWVSEGRAVTERPVVSAGQYGANLNRLLFEFDAEGSLAEIDTDIVDLFESGAADPVYPEDPAVAAVVQAAEDEAEILGAEVLGSTEDPLYRARPAGGNPGDSRGTESTLGNAVADVHLWATQTAGSQIAFMNPGGLRADLLGLAGGDLAEYPSDVTYRQAASVQPFANTLVTMTMTGSSIKAVLEEQWRDESRPVLALGTSTGFEYTYDPAAAQGERILSMSLDGEPIAPTDEFKVALNSFLAPGQDGFTSFSEGYDRADSGRVDLQAMVDYLRTNVLASDYAQHSVGVSGLPAELVPGQDVSVELSSLVMTDPNGVVDSEVELLLGGESLGSFAVDSTLQANALNEHGTASATFTVPALADGEALFTVVGADTGTEVSMPVTIANPVASACEVDYTIHGEWPGGFISQVWLTNTSDETVKNWKLTWSFEGDETITNLWSGKLKQRGADVTVKNMPWNKEIQPGGAVTFGFVGSTTSGADAVAEFSLNGEACTVN